MLGPEPGQEGHMPEMVTQRILVELVARRIKIVVEVWMGGNVLKMSFQCGFSWSRVSPVSRVIVL